VSPSPSWRAASWPSLALASDVCSLVPTLKKNFFLKKKDIGFNLGKKNIVAGTKDFFLKKKDTDINHIGTIHQRQTDRYTGKRMVDKIL
jgi:hypothetical protein